MDKKFGLTFNGQQVQKDDLDLIGDAAGLADDRALAAMLRVGTSTQYLGKAVLNLASHGTNALVNGAVGKVTVLPCRLFIGSRDTAATDGLKLLRDIRSTYNVAHGALFATNDVSLAANSSGSARIDLIYAAVSVDANSATVLRKVKDPSSKLVTEQSVAVSKVTTCTFSKVTGTPAASPTAPALPTDSGGTYYIPLAYVRVPDGFTASSTVLPTDIIDIAPHISMQMGIGGSNTHPATVNSTLTVAQLTSWANTGTRPAIFLPAGLRGTESLIIAVDTATMADGEVLDTGFWQNRLTKWSAAIAPSAHTFPWVQSGFTGDEGAPNAYKYGVHEGNMMSGLGSTFNVANPDTGSRGYAAYLHGDTTLSLPSGERIGVYCVFDGTDPDTLGMLKLRKTSGVGNVFAVFWIDFTVPFHNL